jgi:hypothetical protein
MQTPRAQRIMWWRSIVVFCFKAARERLCGNSFCMSKAFLKCFFLNPRLFVFCVWGIWGLMDREVLVVLLGMVWEVWMGLK